MDKESFSLRFDNVPAMSERLVPPWEFATSLPTKNRIPPELDSMEDRNAANILG